MKSELKRLALYFMHDRECAVFVDGALWHWGILDVKWPTLINEQYETTMTKDYWYTLPADVPNPERVLLESEMPISLFESA